MSHSLNIAVIGAGHLGKFHARLLAKMPGVNLVGVADPIAPARDALAAECNTRAIADYRELVGQIDAAVIAVPTKYHHLVSLSLIEQGIHLLVEKPITSTLAEADELIAAAKRKNVVLQVGHIERFNPALASVLPHLDQPRYIEAARHSGYTFRSTDVGVVLDLMIHDIDLVLSLVRSPVKHVDAIGTAVLGPHEDVAQTRLTFHNGCVANLSASRVSYLPARQMQIWSRDVYASVDFATRGATLVRPGKSLIDGTFRGDDLSAAEKQHLKDHLFEDLLPTEKFTAEASNAMLDELTDFTISIQTGRLPRVTGEHGRQALAVAYQVLDSIDQHKWDDAGLPVGAAPSILRGPHWDRARINQREAG